MGDVQIASQEIDQIEEIVGKRFLVRAIAFVIDMVLINYVNLAIRSAVDFYAPELFSKIAIDFLGLFLLLSYFVLFEWLYGATLGKVILRMRVVKVDGDRCQLGTAVSRGLWRLVDGILFGVVAFAAMEPPLYQRHGDKLAKTIVVGSNDPIIKQPREWWWFFSAASIYLVLYFAVISIMSMLLIA